MTAWVVFEVRCPTLNVEDLRLVGSLPELGAWDPARALPLSTSERTYPVWRTAEISLPSQLHKAVQYKYLKVFGGAVVQWEAGQNRVLEQSCLCENMVNYVDDISFDVKDNATRRSGVRIRFQESSKSQFTSVTTSRFASSVPSPLRTSAGQTPVEKSPSCIGELESILRELKELEPMNLQSRSEIRRAIKEVQSAVEVERSGGRSRWRSRRSRSMTCAMVSLLMVPLLPMMVATSLIVSIPSARARYDGLMSSTRESLRKPLARFLDAPGRACALIENVAQVSSSQVCLPSRANLHIVRRRCQSRRSRKV
mmetsp:Transcript_17750/g.31061  ORF Transcript_17750/g.31061 Transcript_17750/m.31061 type:complete len:311 (+) Transcript_17750:139-1071(+)